MMMMMSTTIAYVDVDVDSHVDDGLWRIHGSKDADKKKNHGSPHTSVFPWSFNAISIHLPLHTLSTYSIRFSKIIVLALFQVVTVADSSD